MIPDTFEGFHIHHYKEVSSTNTEALNLIDKGISSETVIIADKQTSGKGRTGKNWLSPEGNFYASLIIDLLQIPPLDPSVTRWDNRLNVNKLTEITFIAALAVGNTLLSLNFLDNQAHLNHQWCHPSAKTLGSSKLCLQTILADEVPDFISKRNTIGEAPAKQIPVLRTGMTGENSGMTVGLQYKWPNDILIDSKKISGILLERKSNSNWLIIGIGINIISAPLPETTCISDYGNSISNINLLKELIINFNKLRKQWLLSGFYAIREMWLQRAFKLNKQISIKLADKVYEGAFTDIDKSGRLVLQQKDGSLIYFDAGELFIDNVL